MNTPLSDLLAWYQNLSPQTLPQIGQFYTPDAVFKDPFNRVEGPAAIARIFTHMFGSVAQPRFVVDECVLQGSVAYARWNFYFNLNGQACAIHGVSRFELAADGRIQVHRDYWDAAEELYEKLPLVGFFARRLRKRLQAP